MWKCPNSQMNWGNVVYYKETLKVQKNKELCRHNPQ